MESLIISIDLANAAFADDPNAEVARILRELATRVDIEGAFVERSIRDINGNTVGTYEVAAS